MCADTDGALAAIAALSIIRLLLVQIQELQKEYGGSTEGSEPIRPLAHILLEAKQAKDEAFQNQWKQMKQGTKTEPNVTCMSSCTNMS